jgi:predicted ATPase/class 3 adenylate cyclase
VSSPPTGTVTFLFTDIEGSTKLWERSPEAMQRALVCHDKVPQKVIEPHGGYVFKTVGDAFCAAFAAATHALEAALETQRALLEEEWEVTGPLRVRMALHTGAAEERGGDYFGPPVNRVARLLSAGHGGQVLLSLATQELVRDELPEGVSLRDLGERRLKDLFRPERVFQILAPGLPSSFQPLKTLDATKNNLPAQPTPLVGREREVGEVSERLRSPEVRLLTLTGPGGTGKTRLALQAAADLLEEFEDGTYFVALATVTDPELVASTIAEPLGVRESGEQPLEESLKSYLKDKRLLLILDNFEQILEGAPLVGELVGTCPELKVLATSRIPLRLYGEQEYPVPPLTLPDPRVLPPAKVLTQYEAVRLFVERARALKADFEVTNESAPAVAEICVRLDGLPLAIELAAARVRVLPPQKMLKRLSNRLKLLKGGARDLPTRQQTLRGAIDWSHELLEDEEKVFFRRLSVFSGGRTLEAIEEVCDAEGDLDVLEGVESLLEKSLLRQEEGPEGEPRFAMLETIHEYARERLEESGEVEATKRAHAEYFLALAEEPELEGPDQLEWLDRLEAEHDNMRAALSWSLGGADADLGLRLAGALWLFWNVGGHLSEGRKWLEGGLAEERATPEATRAKALRGLGILATGQGDLGRATELLEESLALYRGLGDDAGTARALTFLGFAAIFQVDLERARTLGEEALALSRRLGDRWNVGLALNVLALSAHERGDREGAAAAWEESLALARKRDDAWSALFALINAGLAALVGDDFERASAMLEEALENSRKLQDKQGVALSLCNLGWVALHRGDHERARALFGETLKMSREMGAMNLLAECLEGMAGVAAAEDAERAALLWGAAEALREEIAAPLQDTDLSLQEPYRTFVRSRLDEAAFEAAFAGGRNMALRAAIAYTLWTKERIPEPGRRRRETGRARSRRPRGDAPLRRPPSRRALQARTPPAPQELPGRIERHHRRAAGRGHVHDPQRLGEGQHRPSRRHGGDPGGAGPGRGRRGDEPRRQPGALGRRRDAGGGYLPVDGPKNPPRQRRGLAGSLAQPHGASQQAREAGQRPPALYGSPRRTRAGSLPDPRTRQRVRGAAA